jgi:hypothetical protein
MSSTGRPQHGRPSAAGKFEQELIKTRLDISFREQLLKLEN